MNFEGDVSIDENALDIEWLKQPRLMLSYATEVAKCKRSVDLLKERLDVVSAELDKSIRENPDNYGLTKITEAVVQNNIKLQPEYERTYHELVDARYALEISLAAVRAIDQKKTALENLVRLYGQQYFAGPSVPRDLSAEWAKEKQQKRVDGKVARRLKRSRSKE